MTEKRDRTYLEHILECVALLQDYTRNGKAEFMASPLITAIANDGGVNPAAL